MKNLNLKNQLCLVVLFTFCFCAFPICTSALSAGPKNPVPVQLKQVFTTKVISGNKDILKLYDDNTYEFLFFQIKNKKPVVKRERGTYHWKKNKLSLAMKGKTMIKEHSTRFIYKEEKGLYKVRFFDVKKAQEPEYAITDDKKYWEPLYFDSVYGYITNDKKALKKIIQLKKEEPVKPAETEQPSEPAKVSELINEDGEVTTTETNNTENFILPAGSLKKLKAVIVVSDVDGDEPDGWWNKTFLAQQKMNAQYLRERGVQVKEFYHPNTKWKDIVKASEGANLFIYSGHGSNQGINYPSGGLCLLDGIKHASEIKSELKLHKNALVIFNSACSSAGSSADDKKDIGYKEAQKRVAEYAYPFLVNTNGAYLANNNIDWMIPFFMSFFSGKSLNEIYTKELLKDNKAVPPAVYSYDMSYKVGVSYYLPSNPFDEIITISNGKRTVEKVKSHNEYSLAYVSKPGYGLRDLIK